jgi:glucokinase
MDRTGRFLVDRLMESPSHVTRGPAIAIESLIEAVDAVLQHTGVSPSRVDAIGLATPGPASATGVISSRGSTNFADPGWRSFDYRGALERRLEIPVTYINDGNAAALYAHTTFFGPEADQKSSLTAIVGTGLGGGAVESGRVISGATGTAAELGHIRLQVDGILEPGQSMPRCNCGAAGDVESIASLTAIEVNLLPFWLGQYPGHPLSQEPLSTAAKRVRGFGESGDEMALRLFEQQAMAIGRLFSLGANFLDADAYFVGGGVIETSADFRDWFLKRVGQHAEFRDEQRAVVRVAIVPDGDMAGARGAAMAASAQAPST